MDNFKTFRNERMNRNLHLANSLKVQLQAYGKLKSSDIDKIISSIMNTNIPYYKQNKAKYQDYKPPIMVGFEKDIERMFNHALASTNKAIAR